MISRLSSKECESFLAEQRVGRLGCVLESGRPYVVPVNFLLIGGEVFIHTRSGLKTNSIRTNPNVCLQTDEESANGLGWKSVIVFGDVDEVEDKNIKISVLNVFYEAFPVFTPVEATSDDDNGTADVYVFRIRVDEITGVRESF